MEQHHRKLINNHLSDLIMCTSNVPAIVNILLEKDIINKWMKNHILGPKEDNLQKQNLYKLIQGRGPTAFSALCRTLEDTSNIKARNILLSSKSSIETTEYKSDDLLNNEISNIDLDNLNPYVKVHPQRIRMDIHDVSNLTYPMGSNPKGHALILNVNKIINKEERTGSNVDVANLMKLFKGLGYIIELIIDSTEEELKETVKQFIINCDNSNANSIVVFIMSHGEAGKDSPCSTDIITADGKRFNINELVEQFGYYNFNRNVPKMFFIQACRGVNTDHGWISMNNKNNKLQNDSTTITNTTNPTIGQIVNRRYENVFISYATVPGYSAKRDPVEGSWFVQKFCEVIRKNAWKLDLEAMMKRVDLAVRDLNSVEHGFQTTEWSFRGFHRKLYFNPGLYDDDSDQ